MLTKPLQRKKNTEKGAVFIEILLGLPVMLALIFIFIGFGSLINAREALSSAVGNGLRLARTRGDIVRMRGPAALPSLSNSDASCEDRYGLLEYGVALDQGSFAKMGAWNAEGAFPQVSRNCESFATAFPYYYYLALAYTYEGMRRSVSNLRYPCDLPSVINTDGAGCLKCVFLNPQQAGSGHPLRPYPAPLSNLINEQRFGLRCEYAPNELSVKLALRILNIFGSQSANSSTVNNEGVGTLTVTAFSSAP